jgi:hypothetical protein
MTPRIAAALFLSTWIGAARVASAQEADDAPPVPPRVELGAMSGLTGPLVELGAFASVPTGQGPAFELVVSWMPGVMFDDYDDESYLVSQAQLRVPFGQARRSRRSLVVGVTSIRTLSRHRWTDSFLGDNEDHDVRPHAGASLQWPMGRHADFRFDAQGIFTFSGELPLIPRALALFVWHR